jgi:glycosyltransferase involved in cell wall biosynthesis
VGLVFVGDGEERAELIRRSRQVNPGQVLFPGFVQRDELAAFYALAEIFVFPTHSDTWGFVVNEAIACGLSVIATDVAGCVMDLVRHGENGYVVKAGQPEALLEALGKLLDATALQKQMGLLSGEISARYTPETWAAGVAGAVRGCAGERRG